MVYGLCSFSAVIYSRVHLCCTSCIAKCDLWNILYTHIPQHSFVACWTVQFDSKFREFSYKIPRMDVLATDGWFLVFLVALRGCGRQHSRHALRKPLWNRGKAYLARKSRGCSARSGMLRMDCSSANRRVTFPKDGEKGSLQAISISFSYGRWWSSFP